MKQVWTSFYWSDYLTDTAELSLIEHGAYMMLLAYYYTHAGFLPANAEQLHRICRAFASAEQAAVQVVLQRYFILDGDRYRHNRADRELSKSAELSEKRRVAANSRHHRQAASAVQLHSNSNASAMQLDTQSQSHSHNKTNAMQMHPDSEDDVFEVAHCYPKLAHLNDSSELTHAQADAIIEALAKDGKQTVLSGTKRFVAELDDPKYAPDPVKFFSEFRYRAHAQTAPTVTMWRRKDGTIVGGVN